MAALIAMPIVAFVLLMIMAAYEDRVLPRPEAPADPPETEPDEAPARPAPRPAFSLIVDPRLTRRRVCRVRHADSRTVRRPHTPVAQATAPAAAPMAPADQPDSVPYVPEQVTKVPRDVV